MCVCVREGADSIMVIGHCLPSCSYTNTRRNNNKGYIFPESEIERCVCVCVRERECSSIGEKERERE